MFLTLCCLLSQASSCIDQNFYNSLPYFSILDFILSTLTIYNFTFKHTNLYLPTIHKDSTPIIELQDFSSSELPTQSKTFTQIDERKNFYFHVTMMIWSCAMVSVVSNFSAISGGMFIVYFRGTLGIGLYGLYTWTLIAPKLLPDREFS